MLHGLGIYGRVPASTPVGHGSRQGIWVGHVSQVARHGSDRRLQEQELKNKEITNSATRDSLTEKEKREDQEGKKRGKYRKKKREKKEY